MKRSLDGADLNEALSHASLMLNEMRTSVLTPKNYYELCTLLSLPAIIDPLLPPQDSTNTQKIC
jgi:hypothetical protein